MRCVVVVDEELAPGLAANAAAVMAVTLGARLPALVGEDFEDAAGERHPGLITTGLPVLRAPAAELPALRRTSRRGRGRRGRLPGLRPADDRLRGLPGDGRPDRNAGLPRARAVRPGARCGGSRQSSVAARGSLETRLTFSRALGVGDDRDLPQDRRVIPAATASAIAIPTTIRCARLVSFAVCLAFSACSSAFSSSRPAHANSRLRIARAIGMTASAGPGSTSIASPPNSSVKPATTNATRTMKRRSRWRSRWSRSRSTSDGLAASPSLIPLR